MRRVMTPREWHAMARSSCLDSTASAQNHGIPAVTPCAGSGFATATRTHTLGNEPSSENPRVRARQVTHREALLGSSCDPPVVGCEARRPQARWSRRLGGGCGRSSRRPTAWACMRFDCGGAEPDSRPIMHARSDDIPIHSRSALLCGGTPGLRVAQRLARAAANENMVDMRSIS